MSITEKSVVRIFVRLVEGNGDHQRQISLRIPDGIDPIALLNLGFAIDGNQAVATVGPADPESGMMGYVGPFQTTGASLNEALRDTQVELVQYLREHGFEPRFS